jgi:AraC-like DNA-binding protein
MPPNIRTEVSNLTNHDPFPPPDGRASIQAQSSAARKESGVAEVAERVGYSSASTFSVAFTRYAGLPPTRYAREQMESQRP